MLGLLCCVLLCLTPAAWAEEEDGDEYDETPGFDIVNGVLIVEEGVESIGMDGGENNCDTSTLRLFDVIGVQLPSSLRRMGDLCFYGLGAKSLDVPEGVESIGELAFQYGNLESVALPSTVTSLSPYTFMDCDQLTRVTISPENPAYQAIDGVIYTKDGRTLVCYPAGRTGSHFDVPVGVKAIGGHAFYGNDYLESVSLPLGLETIEDGGFSECGQLRAAALPLTLKKIGDYGFANCVNLEQIAVPDGVSAGQTIFYNCPRLRGYDQWQEPELTPDEVWAVESGPKTYGIVNPENAADMTPLLDAPGGAAAQAQLGCGTTVQILGQTGGFYRVTLSIEGWETSAEGYLPCDRVVLSAPTQSLFTLAGAAPFGANPRYYDDMYALPFAGEGRPLRSDGPISDPVQYGQWVLATQHGSGVTDYDDSVHESCSVFPAALLFTRRDKGDGKTYGMVVSSRPQSRLNVREQPDKSGKVLGKYFSGAHVEILGGDGDWYRVRVAAYDLSGTIEGYAMKEFIRIVPVEE